MKDDSGAVLIVCLWALLFLSLLAMGLAYRTKLDIRLTGYQAGAVATLQMAKGALAVSRELAARVPPYAALNQEWSGDPENWLDFGPSGGGVRWIHEIWDEDGPRTLQGLSDEESRLNLNTARIEEISRLPGMDINVAGAIVDWRDSDAAESTNGGESYPGSLPRNAPFENLDELLLVRGMSRERFDAIFPFATFHGSGLVNVNTAPPEVFAALGVREGLLEKILEFRRGDDLLIGTADDGVFKSVSSISADLSKRSAISPDELKRLGEIAGRLTVGSTAFRMVVEVRRDRVSRLFTAVFERSDPDRVVYWNERF